MSNNTQAQTPIELSSALARPLDLESIDHRMAAHVEWEGNSRTSPRNFEDESSRDRSVNYRRVAKKAGAVLAAGTLAFGAVRVTERAIDQELDTGRPTVEHTGSMFNTGVDKDGNVIRIYPGSVNK